jgi:hypothetical protein
MACILSPEVLEDDLAVSIARALAEANKRAREAGINLGESLISISQAVAADRLVWRINYGPKDYIDRRGGDLIIEVDPVDATVQRLLRGQ